MSDPGYFPSFYSCRYVRDPVGNWYHNHETVLIQSSEVLDTTHHASPEITSSSQNNHYGPRLDEQNESHYGPRLDKQNKFDPPAHRLSRKTRNKNKFNTTCRRCGSKSHRSKLCPAYGWSDEICEKCHRFHPTSQHTNMENCWVIQFVVFLASTSSTVWWDEKFITLVNKIEKGGWCMGYFN